MRQMTLAHQAEFQRYSKKTRREQFLEEMDAVMPWGELLALVAPHYSKGDTVRVRADQRSFTVSSPSDSKSSKIRAFCLRSETLGHGKYCR